MSPTKRPGGKSPRKSKAPKTRARSRKPAAVDTREVSTAGATTVPPQGEICYPLRYPDRYDDIGLAGEIGIRLAGRPADGSRLPVDPRTGGRVLKVIWVDAGDTVLVHLDSVQVKLLDQAIVASIDMECDQTGRVTMVCVFVTSTGSDPAGLVCVTDEVPRGNALMAARWGSQIQAALWSALLGLVDDYARERNLAPLALIASPGALQLSAGASMAIGSAFGSGTGAVK